MTYSMQKAKFLNLADYHETFSTRPRGREMYKKFALLADNTDTSCVVVCWDEVRAASPSFIDEFVGHIAEASKKGDLPVVVFTGQDEYVMKMLDTILRRRDLEVKHAPTKDVALCQDLETLGGHRMMEAATA